MDRSNGDDSPPNIYKTAAGANVTYGGRSPGSSRRQDTQKSPATSPDGRFVGTLEGPMMAAREAGQQAHAEEPSSPGPLVAGKTSVSAGDDDGDELRILMERLESYLRLHDEVQAMRVSVQQRRTAAARARREVAKRESLIKDAYAKAKSNGVAVDAEEHGKLLTEAERARAASDPTEEELERWDFVLLDKEEHLLRDGHRLRQLLSGNRNDLPPIGESTGFPIAALSLPSLAEAKRKPSTIFSYESETESSHHSYVDQNSAETQSRLGLHYDTHFVDDIAPELNSNPEPSKDDDDVELYVANLPELEGARANTVEHMGRDMIDKLSRRWQTFSHSLGKFFPEPGSRLPLSRWMLHYSQRRTAHDMINANTFDICVQEASTMVNEDDDGYSDWILVRTDEKVQEAQRRSSPAVRTASPSRRLRTSYRNFLKVDDSTSFRRRSKGDRRTECQ